MVELIKHSIINQYVIYKNPKDFPGKYVVRKWEIQRGGPTPAEAISCETIKEARSCIPEGLVKFERSEQDHPSIYEVWG